MDKPKPTHYVELGHVTRTACGQLNNTVSMKSTSEVRAVDCLNCLGTRKWNMAFEKDCDARNNPQ